MDSDTLQVFQSELTCSICTKCFLDPVTIDCGHSFCRPCLSLCWEESQTPRSCPECREIPEWSDFKTNIALKRLASLARQARADHDHSSEEQICVTHQEAKGLFCEVDQTLLCGPCSELPEHAAHSHSPIHRAAEESREKLVKRMRTLWKLREEMKISLNQEANKTQSFENYVALRKAMITVQYQRIPLLLHEDEKMHLEALEQEAKEICQQLKGSVFTMTEQAESMREMYRELTEMCHKPDMELLQSLGSVPSCRSKSVQLHLPQPVVPEFNVWPIPGLIDWLRQFQVYIELHNERVTHHLPVFEDLRCLLAGPDGPDVDYTPPRSIYFLSWGAESFTSGQHYWEVDVAGCCNWAIGLCNDSWARESDMALDSKGIFLLLCIKENSQHSLFTSFPPLPQYVKKPLGQVGMFLDYDGGILSFYDVANSSLICSFLYCSFSSPLKPFLCSRYP
uniref:Tripartite motif-containing protein 64-like n=1 Tax=Bos indicus x Bos taurus TaxID=30522 RepID=A0A4W2FTT1_BOBOX